MQCVKRSWFSYLASMNMGMATVQSYYVQGNVDLFSERNAVDYEVFREFSLAQNVKFGSFLPLYSGYNHFQRLNELPLDFRFEIFNEQSNR